jgi:hypothetical protein
MELAEPFQAAVHRAMADPRLGGFWLQDMRGQPMTCNVFCRSMPGMAKEDPRCLAYYWNWLDQPGSLWHCYSTRPLAVVDRPSLRTYTVNLAAIAVVFSQNDSVALG